MAVACATAAVYAPAAHAAATVSNTHEVGVSPTAVTYTDDSAAGSTLQLGLAPDGAGGNDVVFGSAAVTAPVVAESTDPTAPIQTNDCFVGAVDTAQCPASAPINITMGSGNDTIKMGDAVPPALSIDGSAGTDQLDLSQRTTAATVNLDGSAADGVTLSNIENATGGSADDTINGNGLNNRESGSGGNDTLNGAGGDDTLSGGTGDDTLTGGTGINALRGGPGADTLTAGDEGDLLVGGPDADTMTGGAGDDDIVAADGFADTITCGAGVDSVVADLGANGVVDTIVDPTACESVTGSVAVLPDPPPTTDPGTTTTTIQPVIVVPATGTPALVPVLAPGPANFADLTPPSASMRSFTRQRLATVVKRGVPIRVTCKEACGISVALSVDRTTARRLKLDSRVTPVIIATATAQRRGAGTTEIRAKFTKRAKAALAKSKRGVVATTQVLVSDASGNGTLLSRHVTLVR
jgi:hypothetical protein